MTGLQGGPERPRNGIARRVAIGAVVALVLLFAGAAGGWWVSTRTTAESTPEPSTHVLRVPTYTNQAGTLMPDVRGLTEDAAKQVIADSGIPASVVQTVRRPAAADEGTVVDQAPAFGTIGPAAVRIVISGGAVVPRLVGVRIAEAVATLERLGSRVERTAGYDASRDPGVVLSIAPPAGRPLPEAVRVVVNSAPTSIFLSQVAPAEGGCASGAVVVGGAVSTSSLRCDSGTAASPRESVWLLKKAVDVVTGTVGIEDSSATDRRVHVQVLVDRSTVFDRTIGWGDPIPLTLSTSSALRLSVRVSAVGSGPTPPAAFAAVELQGGSDAMKRLQE